MGLKANKKFIIAGSIIVALLVVLALYAVTSLRTWQNIARMNSVTIVNEFRTKISSDSTLSSLTAEQISALTVFAEDSTQPAPCYPSWLYDWQKYIFNQQLTIDACESRRVQLINAQTTAKNIVLLINDTNAIAAILQPIVNTSYPVPEDQWNAQLTVATSAAEQLNTLAAAEMNQPIKEAALTAAKNLQSSWQALIDANEANNTEAFSSATQSLAKAYADFSEITTAAETIFATITI